MTDILKKIFANGFYKIHAGALLFLFSTLIIYFFFINTLGTVPMWAVTEWNLAITLALVSSPLVLIIYLIVCLGYGFKSWQYVVKQLSVTHNEFLFYSTTSFRKYIQFKSWFLVQFKIFLPLWIYTIFATVIGLIYGYYILPISILLFLAFLNAFIAYGYVQKINSLVQKSATTTAGLLTKKWAKPFFILFTYQVLDKMKLTFLITKIVSYLFIICVSLFFTETAGAFSVGTLTIIILITAHAIIIYKEYGFNEHFLYFSHNFPFSKIKMFLGPCLNYAVILFPEILWLVTTQRFDHCGLIILLGFAILLLYRSIMYAIGNNMKRFLFWIFLIFNILFLGFLYTIIWYFVPMMLIISYLIFSRNYSNEHLSD